MSNYTDEIRAMLTRMDKQENQESQDKTQPPPADDIQDVYVLIVREHEGAEEQAQIIDSTPPAAPVTQAPHALAPVSVQQDAFLSAYSFVCFSLLLIFATLAFQLYSLFNPPIATITIMPKSQTVILTGTVQLGKLLPPITISQSQTVATTGHGHQDAKHATGYLTFYNGLFASQTIAAGTILTGADGRQIVTDQDAIIPAGVPPSYGYTTISAHASNAGTNGNIPAYDINEACCATSVLVKNSNAFYGGQDERNFQVVAKTDITNAATPLKATLKQSIQGALHGQLRPQEQLQAVPCLPTVTSDHQPGDEATHVTVTVAQTCSAVAYNREALQTKATALLTERALPTTKAGYSLFGLVRVTVKEATITQTAPPLVFLSFHATGTWIYALSHAAQLHIKELLAGKTKRAALQLLQGVPGIERGAIAWGDDTKLPKDSKYIHITLFVS